jgi:hypothetical protein
LRNLSTFREFAFALGLRPIPAPLSGGIASKFGARLRLLILISASFVPAAPSPTFAFPPADYFPFGTFFAEAVTNGDFQCGTGLAVASQLWGTGGPLAVISFDQPIAYQLTDKNGGVLYSAVLGAVAEINFTSSAEGTVTFDLVPQSGSPVELNGKTFPFLVQTDNFAGGAFEFDFTIDFPNCSLPIKTSYEQ